MNKLAAERLIILQLASTMAHRKLDECQEELGELEQKQSIMKADGASFEDEEVVNNAIDYMSYCLDGWQETIDLIRDWEKEITQKKGSFIRRRLI